ncbi:MAG: hypothetical protein HY433_00470 [Candidatus Liptonbacteria bacterium]|nr:hypothetical protein [Candidatus Liptonbacteria bacterium]
MNFSLIYLANRFFYRLFDFFHHWYVDGSRVFFHHFISFLERLDRYFAVKITVRYFFRPLYGDYTIMGRVLGVFFRSARILIGSAVYLFFSAIFLVVYFLWLLVPAILILYVIRAK